MGSRMTLREKGSRPLRGELRKAKGVKGHERRGSRRELRVRGCFQPRLRKGQGYSREDRDVKRPNEARERDEQGEQSPTSTRKRFPVSRALHPDVDLPQLRTRIRTRFAPDLNSAYLMPMPISIKTKRC